MQAATIDARSDSHRATTYGQNADRTTRRVTSWLAVVAVVGLSAPLTIPQATAQESTAQEADEAKKQAEYAKFEKLLTGAKLVGNFTVVGRPQEGALPKESYEIVEVKKMNEGDKWTIRARIKYGTIDAVVPIPLDVRFVDDTPMITLTKAKTPLGEFSARVIFYNQKYAGTWTHHGKGGGHLFGTIEHIEQEAKDK